MVSKLGLMTQNFLKYGVGIDMSKEKFDACISGIDSSQRVTVKATRKFPNSRGGYDDLLLWCMKHCKQASASVVFLLEATGVYYEQLSWHLHKEGKDVSVILPNKAKKYKDALGLKSKNDTIDAIGLSKMACEQNLALWKPASEQLYTLKLLTRQVEQNAHLATQLKNQLHALKHGMFRDQQIEEMVQKKIDMLKDQKVELEERIRAIVESDSYLKGKFEKICRIKGLGFMSLAVLVAETDGFELIQNRAQLVSYAGYDVVENRSGKHIGKTRISKKGNSHIRRAMYFPAFNMVKYKQGQLSSFYQRVNERTKSKMKGYVAVQRKLLLLVYALWKKDEAFDPHYNSLSGNQETKSLFQPQTNGTKIREGHNGSRQTQQSLPALDGHQFNLST